MTKLPAQTEANNVSLLDANSDSLMLQETSLWLQNFISDRTRATYKKSVQDFAVFAELETPDYLYDVDASSVLAWREHLIANEMSNSSVVNRMSALSSLFKHLCDKQIVQTNPVQGIKRPKTPQQGVTPSIANKLVRKILDNITELIDKAKTPNAALLAARDSAILHVLFYLGPRVSEVCAMNVGDNVADGEYTVVKLTVKGGSAHRVPAPP